MMQYFDTQAFLKGLRGRQAIASVAALVAAKEPCQLPVSQLLQKSQREKLKTELFQKRMSYNACL